MSARSMEIIAVTSGKGGTGKTIISACLGYALTRAGHRVLIVDADLATDGISLFLLGPEGISYQTSIRAEGTFANVLEPRPDGSPLDIRPIQINRGGQDDHGVIYQALISSTGLYGDSPPPTVVERDRFRQSVRALFEQLEERGDFDYVIVDTRGGFSFETTDVCALAHSFILVTEADYTSFYQARNLVREVSAAAQELDLHPVLRSIFVNKALEVTENTGRLDLSKMEVSFRLELVKEFEQTGIRFEDTHPVPLDAELLWAYKTQRVPLRHAPAYKFSFAVLNAFAQILRVVTSPWERAQAEEWNRLVDAVSEVIKQRNAAAETEIAAAKQQREAVGRLEGEVARLQQVSQSYERELTDTRDRYQRELSENRDVLERRHQRELEDRASQHERELARAQEAQARLHERELAEAKARSALELSQSAADYRLALSEAEARRQREVDLERRRADETAADLAGTRRALAFVRIVAVVLGLLVLAIIVVGAASLLSASLRGSSDQALTPVSGAQPVPVPTPLPTTPPAALVAQASPAPASPAASPAVAQATRVDFTPVSCSLFDPTAQAAAPQTPPCRDSRLSEIANRVRQYVDAVVAGQLDRARDVCCTPGWRDRTPIAEWRRPYDGITRVTLRNVATLAYLDPENVNITSHYDGEWGAEKQERHLFWRIVRSGQEWRADEVRDTSF